MKIWRCTVDLWVQSSGKPVQRVQIQFLMDSDDRTQIEAVATEQAQQFAPQGHRLVKVEVLEVASIKWPYLLTAKADAKPVIRKPSRKRPPQ